MNPDALIGSKDNPLPEWKPDPLVVNAVQQWRTETDPVRRWAWLLIADVRAMATAVGFELPESVTHLTSALEERS